MTTKAGVYRHYKGEEYFVTPFEVRNASNNADYAPVVLYFQIGHGIPEVFFVRDEAEFNEELPGVVPPTRRFQLLPDKINPGLQEQFRDVFKKVMADSANGSDVSPLTAGNFGTDLTTLARTYEEARDELSQTENTKPTVSSA